MNVYVVVGNGTNKEGKPYSKLVRVVETRDGNSYLDLKNPQYVDKSYPLFKKFTNELKEG